ncbi:MULTISPECIES: hypothetical protein [unclassified Novosphingobium]|uniref:hypothetical protein n=1 Tax=unclassified Novosphingobium TaxID=2644732 RepID=UPI000D46E3C7|nr:MULTISPECIES: hypothetical protein [unclassified Novosphingobium]PTR05281.1 hypothetical protein C8K11_1361 [Novosphingobium sp. GV055]PUA93850.1 hypothetical protein C8K12_1361 [Novosphingobium sp. GV061]PUB11110.1 hypothetical protein C8K14_1361 [Novosphingobium sp. GV079]PUB36506.1 hypothetical protein C8K10_1351 [Novosphingobium sp. GV027]
MAVKIYTRTALDHFKLEGDIIGRLVVEYGELEWSVHGGDKTSHWNAGEVLSVAD